MSRQDKQWRVICQTEDLVDNSGVCALIHQDTPAEQQVAVFSIDNQSVFAIGNYDPIGKANVLYRGIVGSVGDEPVVASPLYKQHFSLATGICKEDPSMQVPAFEARINQDAVELFC